jgi:hypothetical protein
LESNGISQLRLGFRESFFSFEGFLELDRAIRRNASLRIVEIGWQLPKRLLLRILEGLTKLPFLETLSLTCCTSLPRHLLIRLVSKPTLLNLELREIMVESPRLWAKLSRRFTSKGRFLACHGNDEHISTIMSHFSASLRHVALGSGNLDAIGAQRICAWTNSRQTPLHELSFAHCTRISPGALEVISREAACTRLKLTHCNLTTIDASILARNLPASGSIEELIIGGEKRFSTALAPREDYGLGWYGFMTLALTHLRVLDIHSPLLSEDEVSKVLELLGTPDACHRLRVESLTLSSVVLWGSCDHDKTAGLLSTMLRCNTSLKALTFQPVGIGSGVADCHPQALQDSRRAMLEKSLADNYTLEHLRVGLTSPRIDFYLALNRAGRRYLRQDPSTPTERIKILARASTRPDVLFWFLQNDSKHLLG